MEQNRASSCNAIGTDGVHVVFVIDFLVKPNFDSTILAQSLDAILSFGNSFLMQRGSNRLTILGSSPAKNTILYVEKQDNEQTSERGSDIPGGQMEKFARITKQFRSNLHRWWKDCINDDGANYNSKVSLLSGAISQALCMIHQHRVSFSHSRVIIFSLGIDQGDVYASQYMKLINCFFAATKINVCFDACSISMSRQNEETAPMSASMEDRFAASILQQGADLTGGRYGFIRLYEMNKLTILYYPHIYKHRYIRIHKVATLLEHLFCCLTPTAQERPSYVLPPKLKISPPAACFCHRKVLDVGYVCSVCVSIFCQYLPFCSTCHSNVFRTNLNKIAHLKSNGNVTFNEKIESH